MRAGYSATRRVTAGMTTKVINVSRMNGNTAARPASGQLRLRSTARRGPPRDTDPHAVWPEYGWFAGVLDGGTPQLPGGWERAGVGLVRLRVTVHERRQTTYVGLEFKKGPGLSPPQFLCWQAISLQEAASTLRTLRYCE